MYAPFYVVIETSRFGTYSLENDHVTKPLPEQLREIAYLVWSGQWDDVQACYLVDPAAGTSRCALTDLANAVDEYSYHTDQDPHDDTADFIENILKRPAWRLPETVKRIHREQAIDYAIDIARGK